MEQWAEDAIQRRLGSVSDQGFNGTDNIGFGATFFPLHHRPHAMEYAELTIGRNGPQPEKQGRGSETGSGFAPPWRAPAGSTAGLFDHGTVGYPQF